MTVFTETEKKSLNLFGTKTKKKTNQNRNRNIKQKKMLKFLQYLITNYISEQQQQKQYGTGIKVEMYENVIKIEKGNSRKKQLLRS